MQRIKLLIPDLLTGLNICIGFVCVILIIQATSTTVGFHHNYVLSAWLIVIAGLIDILDGAIARWFGKTGAFGIEFDSIADFTVFAVAPSTLLYVYFYKGHSIFFVIVPLLYLVSAAYRLARFNTNALESSRKKIVGLGTPISAVIVIAAVLLVAHLELTFEICRKNIIWGRGIDDRFGYAVSTFTTLARDQSMSVKYFVGRCL